MSRKNHQRPNNKSFKSKKDKLYRERHATKDLNIKIDNIRVLIRPHAMSRFHERILGKDFVFDSDKSAKKHKELFGIIKELFLGSEFFALSVKGKSFVMRAVYDNQTEVFFILNFNPKNGEFEVPTVFSRNEYANEYIRKRLWFVLENTEG